MTHRAQGRNIFGPDLARCARLRHQYEASSQLTIDSGLAQEVTRDRQRPAWLNLCLGLHDKAPEYGVQPSFQDHIRIVVCPSKQEVAFGVDGPVLSEPHDHIIHGGVPIAVCNRGEEVVDGGIQRGIVPWQGKKEMCNIRCEVREPLLEYQSWYDVVPQGRRSTRAATTVVVLSVIVESHRVSSRSFTQGVRLTLVGRQGNPQCSQIVNKRDALKVTNHPPTQQCEQATVKAPTAKCLPDSRPLKSISPRGGRPGGPSSSISLIYVTHCNACQADGSCHWAP